MRSCRNPGNSFLKSYRKYNFPYILVRHKKYQAATGILKDLAPAKYFFKTRQRTNIP